jgi:fumarate hydratase class II
LSFGLDFQPASNRFARLSSQDVALEVSAALRGAAAAINKICTDSRWMNSGPVSGLGEIELQALQPGSSMMPGKVNPVIPEAVAMICAQVIGCDATINAAAMSSVFELNVMQPVVAWNLLTAISLLSNGARALATQAIAGFRVNEERLSDLAKRNPILVTALAPRIGYEAAAHIAHRAMATGRGIAEIALEQTDISRDDLQKLLDPVNLTNGGLQP